MVQWVEHWIEPREPSPSAASIILGVFLMLPDYIIHALVAVMGMCVLWFFYSNGIVYFLVLCGVMYLVLLVVQRHKGITTAVTSLAFLLIW